MKSNNKKLSTKEKIISYSTMADIQAKRIEEAFVILKNHNLMPLKPGDIEQCIIEEIGLLDLVTTRFSKLQDVIGLKIFVLLLKILLEDSESQTMIDKFNRLEKLHYLPSAQDWIDLRNLRNDFAHEYPQDDDFMVKQLNKAFIASRQLLDYWYELRKKLDDVLKKAT